MKNSSIYYVLCTFYCKTLCISPESFWLQWSASKPICYQSLGALTLSSNFLHFFVGSVQEMLSSLPPKLASSEPFLQLLTDSFWNQLILQKFLSTLYLPALFYIFPLQVLIGLGEYSSGTSKIDHEKGVISSFLSVIVFNQVCNDWFCTSKSSTQVFSSFVCFFIANLWASNSKILLSRSFFSPLVILRKITSASFYDSKYW